MWRVHVYIYKRNQSLGHDLYNKGKHILAQLYHEKEFHEYGTIHKEVFM